MSARRVAAQVLVRVWSEGAFAAAALSTALDRSGLPSRDRGLATEITYGVLRTQKYLEARLGRLGKLKQSDHVLLSHVLVGAYQIEFLDRIPVSAAVNEAVKLVGVTHDRKIAGFCNAILRRLSELGGDDKKGVEDAAIASAPSWLRKRLVRDVGEDVARSLLVPGRTFAPGLRVRREQLPPEFLAWLARSAQACPGVPGAYRYTSGGDPRRSEWFEQGLFVVQELGAQLIAHALGLTEGESVLDVCAGRGQKTSLLAEIAGPSGRVVATDLHAHKVSALGAEMERMGLSVEAYQWDWTEPPPEHLHGAFDRVIVDAPCTGMGTLVRRPEIARRLSADDPARLADLQKQILKNAIVALRPGGVLLYATCSVLREEAEDVVASVSGVGLVPVSPKTPVDLVLFGSGETPSPALRLLPETHGTDGYFLSRLTKALAN